MRAHDRAHDTLRPITITRHFTKHAEGSVLIEFGETKVLCNASIEETVPRFIKGSGRGWVTAEYSMLPRATHSRNARESMRGGPSGRTFEIQRLIARSLRAAVNLKLMGEVSITVDCDVIQADGGTRTASITGGCIALYDAITALRKKHSLLQNPFQQFISAISVGIVNDSPILDLDYEEDFSASTDMNVVMTEDGKLIEIQGTAEDGAFSREELDNLVALASLGNEHLISQQKQAVNNLL